MNLELVRQETNRILSAGTNKDIINRINSLPHIKTKTKISDIIEIDFLQNISQSQIEQINDTAKSIMPWRKGPFKIGNLLIDSEWQSFIKFNLLAPHINIADKIVADVGCNNGYYMYRMLNFNPKKIVGFDPGLTPFFQFNFIDHFIKSGIKYELLGVEHLPFYENKFDVIFCLGVIYHRQDPIKMLKDIKLSLNPNGKAIIDTMYIDMDGDFALCPKNTYSKIPNIYFIPTISALKNWCERAKFKDFKIIATSITDSTEQRKSDWIFGQSLQDFLDPKNKNLTIEGYPAPKRVYIEVQI